MKNIECIFDYRLNIKRGVQYWALKKSTGINRIRGEFYKNAKWQDELLNRLQNHFTEYLHNNEIPDYFMKAKLILVSKEKTEYPKIEYIRPIGVLPTITKVFELSIQHHLENATQSIKFCKTQRDFLKGRLTLNNIHGLLNLLRNLQDKWRQNKQIKPAIVFFDFRKANDSVPRDRLLTKLSQLDVPDNITLLIGNMLKNFWLIYEKEKVKTSRGLVKGSVLSPLLFKIFINNIMLLYQVSRIESRTYADDIVCIWKSIDETRKAILIMKEWWTKKTKWK